MKCRQLVVSLLWIHVACCGAAAQQQQNPSLWNEYQKLSARLAPGPVFLPQVPFWKFVAASEQPAQLENQVRALQEAAGRQHDAGLQARAMILHAQLPTTEQPAALHEIRAARQMLQAISDDEGTALSELGEAYRMYRAGDALSGRAHLYKARLFYSRQHSLEGQLRCLSLFHLLEMPGIPPGDLFSPDADDDAWVAGAASILFGQANETEAKMTLLSSDWQKERNAAEGNAPSTADGWITLFDGYEEYVAGHPDQAAKLWSQEGQSHEVDPLLKGLSWMGVAQISADKIKKNPGAGKGDASLAQDALAKAQQAFKSAQRPGGVAQAELLGSQVDFLLHREKDARERLQRARKIFEDMGFPSGVLETELISAEGESFVGNSAGSLVSLDAARKSLGTVADGAALHGQLLRVASEDIQRLADFYGRNSSDAPFDQHLRNAYEFHAWASETQDPLLKMIALQDLSDALLLGGYLNDFMFYASEKENLLQRYTQSVPLPLRIQKAALLEYDLLRKGKLDDSRAVPFVAFDAPQIFEAYLAAAKALRPTASNLLHLDLTKEDAEFEEGAAEIRKLASTYETHRQALSTALSGDPTQAVRALGQCVADLKALFEYMNDDDVQADSQSFDEKIRNTISLINGPGPQHIKLEADMHVSMMALFPRFTKIEMLQESAYLDFVRDVLAAVIMGKEGMAIDAANNLASFYELYRKQLPSPGEITMPFSFLKLGGIGALDEIEKRRFAERQKDLEQAMSRNERTYEGQVVHDIVKKYAPSYDFDANTLDTGTFGESDPLQDNFEHIKERESPDQTEVTTRKEGDVLVIVIKHSHSAWFEFSAKSEYVRVQPSENTVDLPQTVAVLRMVQDPYLVPASPGLDQVLSAMNSGVIEQLMYASFTGSSLQKAIQNASTFSHIIQAGQVALSFNGANDFISQPGSRSAAEWKTFLKENPQVSSFSSLLQGIQLAAVPDTTQTNESPVQQIADFFGKLGKIVSTISGNPEQTAAEDSDDEDEDDDTKTAQTIGQIPELATLIQYPSLTFLVMDDRENADRIATALKARLPKNTSLNDSIPFQPSTVTGAQRISILTNSALFHIATGSYKDARAELGEVIALTGERNPSEAFQLHYLLAMCARRSNDPEGALNELKSSVEELAHLRSSLTTRSLALALQPVRQMIYEEYMDLARAKDDSNAMLAAVHQYKRSAQIPVGALLQNPEDSDLVSQVAELTLLYDLQSQQAIQADPDASSWLLDSMATDFAKGKQPQLDQSAVALSTLNNVANVLMNQVQPVRLHPRLADENLKYNLKKDQLAIVYFTGSRGLYALTVDDAGTRRVHYTAISADALAQLCQKFRAQIVAREDVSETAAELYRITLGNIAELDGKTRLKIWPDGWLQFVPFQALKPRPDAGYLVQTYVISYITGVSGSAALQAGDGAGELLLVGNPDGSLPAAEDEVNSISRLSGFRPVPLLKQDATLHNLQHKVGAAGLVHFATHARANEAHPNFSFLQLAPSDRLYGIDLGGMRFAGKQVFLSACETKLGEYIPGEDIYGISDVFLAAGAGSVVATLWRVESQSSALFAERYYPAWQAGGDGAAALAQVARDFIEGRSYLERNGGVESLKDPIYWAGFNRVEPWSSMTVQ